MLGKKVVDDKNSIDEKWSLTSPEQKGKKQDWASTESFTIRLYLVLIIFQSEFMLSSFSLHTEVESKSESIRRVMSEMKSFISQSALLTTINPNLTRLHL